MSNTVIFGILYTSYQQVVNQLNGFEIIAVTITAAICGKTTVL